MDIFDELRDMLKKREGWTEHPYCPKYLNGVMSTTFLTDKGTLIILQEDSMPDEEVVEDIVGEEDE